MDSLFLVTLVACRIHRLQRQRRAQQSRPSLQRHARVWGIIGIRLIPISLPIPTEVCRLLRKDGAGTREGTGRVDRISVLDSNKAQGSPATLYMYTKRPPTEHAAPLIIQLPMQSISMTPSEKRFRFPMSVANSCGKGLDVKPITASQAPPSSPGPPHLGTSCPGVSIADCRLPLGGHIDKQRT